MNASSDNVNGTLCEISTFYWVLQFGLLPPLLFLYSLVLFVMFRNKSDFKNSYFTLILSLGVSDFVILLYLYHGFFCCLFRGNYLGVTVDAIITFIMTSLGWFNGLYLKMFISVNRFVAIAMFDKFKQIWTLNRTRMLAASCTVLGVLSTVPYYIAPNPELYNVDYKSPGPPEKARRTDFLILFDMISSNGSVVFIIGLHITSAALCIVRYKSFAHVKQKYVREIKLLVQGTFIGLMLAFSEMFYYFPVFGELTFIYVSILSTGLNPIVYLIMDRRLREKLLLVFSNINESSSAPSLGPSKSTT